MIHLVITNLQPLNKKTNIFDEIPFDKVSLHILDS
jgi:hypothetical protein